VTEVQAADLVRAGSLDLGSSGGLLVDQDRVDRFARATGDMQWIHTDPDRAVHGPFGGAIAHGYLTLSLLGCFQQELLTVVGLPMGLNCGLRSVRFTRPVPVPSTVRAAGSVLSAIAVADGVECTCRLRIDRRDGDTWSLVCIADTITLYLPGER
jgi:acyl dehydratase